MIRTVENFGLCNVVLTGADGMVNMTSVRCADYDLRPTEERQRYTKIAILTNKVFIADSLKQCSVGCYRAWNGTNVQRFSYNAINGMCLCESDDPSAIQAFGGK